MTSVFIGGSRRVTTVDSGMASRLDAIMGKRLHVVIGDASGFDRAAQAYLAEHAYEDVTVYCTSGRCRNNVGNWPIRVVEYSGRAGGFAFYAAKDDAMARDADYGLFAWDAKSKGTLRNILNMARSGKPSVVFLSPSREFANVRTLADATALAEQTGTAALLGEDLFGGPWRATA